MKSTFYDVLLETKYSPIRELWDSFHYKVCCAMHCVIGMYVCMFYSTIGISLSCKRALMEVAHDHCNCALNRRLKPMVC